MGESALLKQIARKGADAGAIADKVIKNPRLLSEIFNGLRSDKARIKYGCDKVLRMLSEKDPEILYPKIDFFARQLDGNDTFFKWSAIRIIANLAAVDSKNKIERMFGKYFAPVPGPVMITAANVIGGAAEIALAKPKLTGRISSELLKVEKARYRTDECRNVAIGHAIRSFDRFFVQVKNKKPVITFIKRQLKNTRNATRKRAGEFIKKYGIDCL